MAFLAATVLGLTLQLTNGNLREDAIAGLTRALALSLAAISTAASHAWSACCGSSSGAFQNAMTASPIYLSIVPR